MTKLKIDLLNGTLDIEGEETFVRDIYNDFKEKLNDRGQVKILKQEAASLTTPKPAKPIPGISRKKSGSKGNTYKMIDNLNIQNLNTFYQEKKPTTAFEKNLVFVYYLQKTEKQTTIGLDHIYSCYKSVNVPVPGALKQSLADTASRKRWIDTSNMNSITVTILGENEVEHKLPPQTPKA